MGCWGITSFESDSGLDAVSTIRGAIPENGQMDIAQVIKVMRKDDWCVPDASLGHSHSGPIALADVLGKLYDGDLSRLDYDDDWADDDNKFASLTACTVDKDSLGWLRGYLAETLRLRRADADRWAQQGEDTSSAFRKEWSGWREKEDWLGWQDYISSLVGRLDGFLAMQAESIDLLAAKSPVEEQGMEQTI